jgi:antitoxin (DNA-binding transcriptional repressor) of toxin-antitoxin stability system
MVTIYVAEGRANLPKYLEMVARGERVVIYGGKVPIAELRATQHSTHTQPRQFGFAEGWVLSGLESLDEPWTEEDLGLEIGL